MPPFEYKPNSLLLPTVQKNQKRELLAQAFKFYSEKKLKNSGFKICIHLYEYRSQHKWIKQLHGSNKFKFLMEISRNNLLSCHDFRNSHK